MTNIDLNPRAVVGDNKAPEYAQKVTDEMRAEYGALEQSVTLALEEARTLPKEINDDKIMGTFARLIKKLRDTAARAEAFRVAEAEPHYRAKQAVDGFFFGLIDKCARRDRKAQPGAADILQARLDDYNQRKLRAEQERLAREEAERRRVAEASAAKAREDARVAEEARLAAERARKPETITAKETVAAAAETQASSSGVEAAIAADQAQAAHVDTLRKPADMVRHRVEAGPLVTMGTEAYAVVVDESLLNKAVLWPFISLDAKEKALRAWAKTTSHNQQMPGAEVGKRPKSRVV